MSLFHCCLPEAVAVSFVVLVLVVVVVVVLVVAVVADRHNLQVLSMIDLKYSFQTFIV